MLDLMLSKGADLHIPDNDGNTILHYLCEGSVRDFEFELIQWLVEVQNMRLVRNREHNSPLSLIKGYPKKQVNLRGQKNMRKEVSELFD